MESLDSGGVARGAEPVGVLEMMPSNVSGGCREASEGREGARPGPEVLLEGAS